MPFLSDTHCHLYLNDFASDQNAVLNRSFEVAIRKILIPGIDLETSRQSIELCEKYPGFLFAAIGIHPNHSSGISETQLISLEGLSGDPKVMAIGEIGLDFYREITTADEQIKVFQRMLSLARIAEKPICIHNRNADNKIIEILDSWYSELQNSHSRLIEYPGVFHSFNGSELISDWALKHNFYLGISGPVTFSKSLELQEKIKNIDISHLLIETDSPYLSPHPYRGKRNEPSNVRLICEKIAELKQLDIDSVISSTSENAKSLFGWDGI